MLIHNESYATESQSLCISQQKMIMFNCFQGNNHTKANCNSKRIYSQKSVTLEWISFYIIPI